MCRPVSDLSASAKGEKNDDEMVATVPPRCHEILVTAAEKFHRRVKELEL
jgi:hypothetical protein